MSKGASDTFAATREQVQSALKAYFNHKHLWYARSAMKPKKRAVSLVIKDEHNNFLIVKRPDDPADELGGVWGFPAVVLEDGETEVEGASRAAVVKLGVKIKLGKRLGENTHDRVTYVLTLADYEATITEEGVPTVPQNDTSITQYSECTFTDDPSILFEATRKGSQCTQIFLESIGVNWQET